MANAALFGEEALGRYDEMLDRTGAVRPHWQRLAASFGAMGQDEYQRRLDSATRMVRENGVTYNVYDEASGLGRLWQLDIAPFVVSADDWTAIEAAVTQRARLANAILHDIYGEQRLLRDGVVPPHLVFGHPQYLRALQGVTPPSGVHVHLYSVDLARANNGSWIVHASRADAPTGLGYALENRVVVSQTFPELFGELGVHRLATFFRHYRDAVVGLGRGASGHAVLLTPGSYNEAYFEHAYLARYLGLELVEGDDLSVRDGIVYLRTLGGLERVAVIFRRLDSDFADPLELRADSELGVPGLVDVIRAGNVVMANALGGGVAESPALDAYLPNASRALFGEELLFSDIPTVWCGTAWGRTEGLARVRRGIVRNAFDAGPLFSRGSSARLGSDLSGEQIAELTDTMERRAATLVVQDLVPLGVAPTFDRGAFASRPMSLRVFAAWTPTGYVVMPGAARTAPPPTIPCARSRCNPGRPVKTCGRWRPARSTRSACSGRRPRASKFAAPETKRPAVRWTTCSGSRATPSVPKISPACCARSCCDWPATPVPRPRWAPRRSRNVCSSRSNTSPRRRSRKLPPATTRGCATKSRKSSSVRNPVDCNAYWRASRARLGRRAIGSRSTHGARSIP